MGLAENIVLVFVAGLLTALATGLGALPFFFVEKFGERWNVTLWGIASGIMVAASLFGLLNEGLTYSSGSVPTLMIGGLLAGVVLVEGSDMILGIVDFGDSDAGHDHDGGTYDEVRTDGDGDAHDEYALEAKAFAEGDLKSSC